MKVNVHSVYAQGSYDTTNAQLQNQSLNHPPILIHWKMENVVCQQKGNFVVL